MLLVIPCGGKKADHPCPAREMYTGPYFRACLGYALAYPTRVKTLILSAKYGLVGLKDVIEPYNLTLGEKGCVTAQDVKQGAREYGVLKGVGVIALGGKRYTDLCRAVWPNCLTPLKGVGGIGYQLQWLKENQGVLYPKEFHV